MECAGRKVAVVAAARCRPGQLIVVLAGPGNNGGDALVASRYLHLWGYSVLVIDILNDFKDQTPDRSTQGQSLDELNIRRVSPHDFQSGLPLPSKPLILDGVLGIGIRGSLREGLYKSCLQKASQLNGTVISIDLPSGMDGDCWSGEAPPLPADITVTFGASKAAHRIYPAARYCGETLVFDIGFSKEAVDQSLAKTKHQLWELAPEALARINPWRGLAIDAHKFERGHVLVIGGSSLGFGAPMMAAVSAARAGAGWVSLATPHPVETVMARSPLALTHQNFFKGDHLDIAAISKFVEQRRVKALLIGPGMVTSPFQSGDLETLARLQRQGLSLVLDAGALHQLGERLKPTRLLPEKTLLTPHPGELIKMGLTPDAPKTLADFEQLQETCNNLGVSIFYKSASPVIVSPELPHHFPCYSQANNSLGKAGSGDVLAGICTALALTSLPSWVIAPLAQCHMHYTCQKLQDTGKEIIPEDICSNLGTWDISFRS